MSEINGRELIRWNTPKGQEVIGKINQMLTGTIYELHIDEGTGVSVGLLGKTLPNPLAEHAEQQEQLRQQILRDEADRQRATRQLIENGTISEGDEA